MCMSKNGKEIKNTIHIAAIMHFVRNGEECNINKTSWCQGGLQLSDNETKNVGYDGFNSRLGYATVRPEKLKEHFYKRDERIQNILKKNVF